jgi:hypothetical protein
MATNDTARENNDHIIDFLAFTSENLNEHTQSTARPSSLEAVLHRPCTQCDFIHVQLDGDFI